MIAVWIPVTVVPTSLTTVAIDTFMTELSSVIKELHRSKGQQHEPGRPSRTLGRGVAHLRLLVQIHAASPIQVTDNQAHTIARVSNLKVGRPELEAPIGPSTWRCWTKGSYERSKPGR